MCKSYEIIGEGFCKDCWIKIDFFSGAGCKKCGMPFEISLAKDLECGRCIEKEPQFDKTYSLFKFDQLSKKIIYGLKYYDKTNFAKLTAKILVLRYERYVTQADLIAPVPMFWFKRWIKLFNHSEIIGAMIAKYSSKPFYPNLLIKARWTKPQSSLKSRERQENIKNTIIVNPKYYNLIRGRKVLLADDVFTTGTTLNECAIVLKKHGARTVEAVTIARA